MRLDAMLALCRLPVVLLFVAQTVLGKEIDSNSDLLQEESYVIPAEHRGLFPDYQDIHVALPNVPRPAASRPTLQHVTPPTQHHQNHHQPAAAASNQQDSWALAPRGETSQIKAINVKCDKNAMKVNIEFDRPFHGVIFSKGHYNDPKCVHLPAGTGQLSANFDIYMGSCGMTTNDPATTGVSQSGSIGMFIENTVIVQYDPQVQEIWDQARKLRCTWYDFYEKSVTFRPFGVDMQDAVTANFLGDNIQCWMQIQVGKGPWASEVAGIVKIGQTMTMVLAIKDEENKFDMLVRNCVAHDGKHQPIQLVDEYGCIVRSKIMSKFQKVRNFGHSASVVSYAYFQAFKFPDSMNVHFQCVIQVCRNECPQPTCDATDHNTDYRELHYEEANKFAARMGELSPNATHASMRMSRENSQNTSGKPRSMRLDKRSKRSVRSADINTQKVIQVVAPGDVAFTLPLTQSTSDESKREQVDIEERVNMVCLSTSGFATAIVTLILLLLLACMATVSLVIRLRAATALSAKERFTSMVCSKHPTSPCACKPSLESNQSHLFIKLPTVALSPRPN